MKVLLLALILNAQTGQPIGTEKPKEFDTYEACVAAKPTLTHPKKRNGIPGNHDMTITVYTCAVPPGMALPPMPAEPIVIDEDDTKANT